MTRVTYEWVMGHSPCREYSADRVRSLCGTGLTVEQVCRLSIPATDRLWVLTMWAGDLYEGGQMPVQHASDIADWLEAAEFCDTPVAMVEGWVNRTSQLITEALSATAEIA